MVCPNLLVGLLFDILQALGTLPCSPSMRFLLVGRNTGADPKKSEAAKDGWGCGYYAWMADVGCWEILQSLVVSISLSWKK